MASIKEKSIIDSWLQNAQPWIHAVQNNEIESRTLATNQAIIGAILKKNPQKVLDIGCGEGWLVRELHRSGIEAHGVDIVPELIEEANKKGGGVFQVKSYQDLALGAIKEKFDVVVCNFSLLGKDSVISLFRCVTDLLNEDGFFIIQTIHPVSGCGDEEYKDGWRQGSWKGFSDNFTNSPPWYFRTLESWRFLFQNNGMILSEILEPLNPSTKTFASIIFTGKIVGNA